MTELSHNAPGYGFSRENGVLLQREEDGQLTIWCREHFRLQAVLEVQRVMEQSLPVRSVPGDEFDRVLTQSFEAGSEQASEAISDLGSNDDLKALAHDLEQPEDLLAAQDDAPIIRLINALLSQAARENASDIHIETFEKRLSVRFRVDGVLREIIAPPQEIAPLLVSRVKVMANLDIAEKRLPQDGRIPLLIGSRPIDIRVSTLPSGHGERVVMRLLDKQAGRLDLAALGMLPDTLKTMDEAIHRPHGILLVTGPTGSGKTTTLYAALGRLNDTTRNILTVEDPVEYFIDGIGQTQINTKVDMSFARGLRAILRQDPDVVMVGEIRDEETARIAVQASLTGHMVFSTLHTNTAAGAITRLRDMGIESFLIASSLAAVLAQRLVRRLCPECRQPYTADVDQKDMLGIAEAADTTLYRAKGCPACSHTGYKGRTGIYELLPVDEKMRKLIHDNAPEDELKDRIRHGGRTLQEDGVARVLEGETTLEELIRVTL